MEMKEKVILAKWLNQVEKSLCFLRVHSLITEKEVFRVRERCHKFAHSKGLIVGAHGHNPSPNTA